MKHSPTYLPGAALVLFIALAVLYLPWLGETLFNSKGEPREAIVAVSMLQSGNWILPVNYGGDIPFKPPFLAWLIAAAAWLFNGGVVNEYISRLPSVIAAIAMVMTGYRWASRQRDSRFAITFSIITITSFEVFRAAMACRLDMVLTACMVIAIYLMHELCEDKIRHKALTYIGIIILLTCATLTKGPVGSLLPCFAMGIYYLLRGRRFFPTLAKMLGLALVSLIVPALWSWQAYRMGGQHFVDLFMEENLGRLMGTMSYESHENPWWYNFMTLAAGLLPWTIMSLFALANTRHFRRSPLKPAGLLSLTVAVVVIGFYCIPASKRSVYLLPAYPFVCYAITCLAEKIRNLRSMKVFAWLIALLGILVPVAVMIINANPLPKLPLEPIRWWGYIMLAIPMLGGAAWIVNRHSPLGHTCVTVWALYLAYISTVMPAVLNPRSDIRILPDIAASADETVYSYSPDNYRFYTLNFYLDDRMRPITTPDEARELPAGSKILMPSPADSVALGEGFRFSRLLDRSCDHRTPIILAVKE